MELLNQTERGAYLVKNSFPDAEITTEDGEPLSECADEPASFQEYLETQKGEGK